MIGAARRSICGNTLPGECTLDARLDIFHTTSTVKIGSQVVVLRFSKIHRNVSRTRPSQEFATRRVREVGRNISLADTASMQRKALLRCGDAVFKALVR